MKRFLLSILCCLLAVVSGYAEEYKYTFSSKQFTANGTKTLKGVEWTLSGEGNYWGYDGSKGQQFGSSKAPYKTMTLSTSGIPGTIDKIVINTSGASSINAKLTVTVGGIKYGDPASLTATVKDYTFEGSASGNIVLTYTQTSSKAIYIKAITITYTDESGTPSTLEKPVFDPSSCSFSNSIDVAISAESGATIYYTLDGTTPTTTSSVYEDPITLGETTTIKAYAVKDGCLDSEVAEATYTKRVLQAGQVEDVLTREWTGIANKSGYKDWSGKTSTSSAVYAGNSAGDNNSIQLRTNNNNSGIVTTASGGTVKKIIIEWEGNTPNGRTLDIYGKNGAYTAPKDLYNSSTSGDKLGSIVYGKSTEFEVTSDYTYIGLRSNSGAMYISSITIIWAEPYELNVTSAGWATLYLDNNVIIPTDVTCYVISEVANGAATLTEVSDVLPAKTGVIIKADEGQYTFEDSNRESEVQSLLTGTTKDTYIEEEAYVLGIVDKEVGLYKAKMNDGKFLNNANKAYLPVSALTSSVQGAASLKFHFDGQTTGIEGVSAVKGEKVIFDLAGRKLNDMSAPGIYIVNGKKVMVK